MPVFRRCQGPGEQTSAADSYCLGGALASSRALSAALSHQRKAGTTLVMARPPGVAEATEAHGGRVSAVTSAGQPEIRTASAWSNMSSSISAGPIIRVLDHIEVHRRTDGRQTG